MRAEPLLDGSERSWLQRPTTRLLGLVHHLEGTRRGPLSWHETLRRFSYYLIAISALWLVAFSLFLISGVRAP
jgi:hypothetical protein